ncbi:hypothetical protein DOTSEDRAFT_48565 [Dothistroma septosporum NZE10]|uniref:AB hydrolase-1 domain-containing protein n=1 Tax=Dothistroma septosporum (strain NZE10 / CBS 128990) TaxID=675120 RepID=N1PBH1_DOTSN|nr:hypothetical protein DOTSEDRAFT_48565 [Dothistroma septosporum NZE10]
MSAPHFVLVHGVYHRAWHFNQLRAELEAVGSTVSDLDLPAAGDTSTIHVDNGLVADAAAILATIEEAAFKHDNIILLFHSYGGLAGSEAAAQLSSTAASKIKNIIYLAAFVNPAGTSMSSRTGGRLPPWSRPTEDGKFSYVPDSFDCFYHDVEPALAKEAHDRLVRQATSIFHTPTKYQGWELFPTTYIFCTDDRALPLRIQKGFFDKMTEEQVNGWRFETIQSSHSPYLSKPTELAKLLAQIAENALEIDSTTKL